MEQWTRLVKSPAAAIGLVWAIVAAINTGWSDAPLWFRLVSLGVGAASTYIGAMRLTPVKDPMVKIDGELVPLVPEP
jgi:hypothetical protein